MTGEQAVDLARAVDLQGERFGVRTLPPEGDGHINGAFLKAGQVDEVSVLMVPGVDGCHDIAALSDGVSPTFKTATALKLQFVERRPQDALWLR